MIVYYVNNHKNSYNALLSELASYLQENLGAKWIRDEKFSDNGDLLCQIDSEDAPLLDCELLIYEEGNDSYKLISFADLESYIPSRIIRRNNENDLIVYTQIPSTQLRDYEKNDWKFKLKNSIYVPADSKINIDELYAKRLQKKEYEDKFIFRGNYIGAQRTSAKLLKVHPNYVGPEGTDNIIYLNEAINYKVGVSIPGVGEVCFRDVEYMGIGLPMMKFEYITQMNPKLIPNHHYISIDRFDMDPKLQLDDIIKKERLGGLKYTEKYIERFMQVKEDKEFLNFISKNAREYYDTYLHPKTRLKHVLNLLEI
jgi:hypothetical protein